VLVARICAATFAALFYDFQAGVCLWTLCDCLFLLWHICLGFLIFPGTNCLSESCCVVFGC